MDYVEIKTMDDIYKYVNKSNLYDFLKDFNNWVKINVVAKIDGIKPVTESFFWKDDKLHNINIKVELVED